MPSDRPISEYSRQELYDLIWSTPAIKLAEKFGISDVAIAKHCKKKDVPRPPRGYWAKLEAGRKPRKEPLPPTREEMFVKAAEKPLGKVLPLPAEDEQLHSLAAELKRSLNAAKPDSQKRVSLRVPSLPEITVTKALAERAAQAFHVILQGVEPRGILFRKSQSSYDGGSFKMGKDYLWLTVEEHLVHKPEESGKHNRRRSSWQRQADDRVGSGYLTFSLKTERYGKDKPKVWEEDGKIQLGEIVAQIVTEIRRHYVDAQKRREQEAIDEKKRQIEWERQQREHQEKEAIRMQEEKKHKHAEAIQAAMRNRKDDLLKAAEWWRLHQVTLEFIEACEQRWKVEQSGELKPEQKEWLDWARKTAEAISPFYTGYPEPLEDGAFSALEVPFGGPYPATREFPRPPSMPEIPAPVVVQQGYSAPPHQPVP